MSMKEWAKKELELAGLFDKDSDYGGMLGDAVLELFEKFCDQGHSGFSAAMTAKIFKRLADGEPLVPLKGTPEEWQEVGDNVYQNRRCSHVFAEGPNGENADNIQGKIFREPSGACYTSSDSWVRVTFPYWPKSEYVDVPAEQ